MSESTPNPALPQLAIPRPWASNDVLEHFWLELARHGTPIWNGDEATFFLRHPQIIPHGHAPIHLHINRVTDKDNQHRGRMQAIPGTDIWMATVQLSPALRASYGFLPAPPPPGPPPHDRFSTLLDPFNKAKPLLCVDKHGFSVVSGPQAPIQSAWESTANVALNVCKEHRKGRDYWLYVPSGCSHPDLLLLTDAEMWFGRLGLAGAMEWLNAHSNRAPVAVAGISNTSAPDRRQLFEGSLSFLPDLAKWAARKGKELGADLDTPRRRVFAGQSLGGIVGLRAAIELPGFFNRIIAQSPSMWWRPETKCSPHDLGTLQQSWITEYLTAHPQPTQIRLEVGTNEGASVPWVRRAQTRLLDSGWDSRLTVYEGGHDYACWRGSLLENLVN